MDKNSEHYKKYKAYTASPIFKSRKACLIEKRGLACEGCPRPILASAELHTHHVTYERLYNELESDLLLLCPTCHRKAHGVGGNILVPEGMEVWQPNAEFIKAFNNSWRYLSTELSTNEYIAAHTFSLMIKPRTNSLSPIKETSSIKELMEIFGLSRNMVRPVLRRLIDVGVCLPDKNKTLIFNPHLSYKGKAPAPALADMFKDTSLTKACYNASTMEH